MGKLVFWIALGVLVWGVARFITLMQRKNEAAALTREREGQGRELILSCAHCGVYVPASEAVRGNGNTFCSAEHRTAHGARRS